MTISVCWPSRLRISDFKPGTIVGARLQSRRKAAINDVFPPDDPVAVELRDELRVRSLTANVDDVAGVDSASLSGQDMEQKKKE